MTALRKTVISDIDGTLIKHGHTAQKILTNETDSELLKNVKEAFDYWDLTGTCIILTTGRRESCRAHTEWELEQLGLTWDHLIMGVGSGPRLLINDYEPVEGPNGTTVTPKAISYNVERDYGLDLDYLDELEFYGTVEE
jgi:hypothetical protein